MSKIFICYEYIYLYIFLLHFVANQETLDFKIVGQKKKWKWVLNQEGEKQAGSYIKDYKKGEILISLKKGSGEDIASEDNFVFLDIEDAYSAGKLGDIVFKSNYFGILLGNVNVSAYIIGNIIEPGDDFKSYFKENQEIKVQLGHIKDEDETETPEEKAETPKRMKKRSDWRTVKKLKKSKALKRYRIIKKLNKMNH